MKKLLPTFVLTLVVISCLFASRRAVEIFEQNTKLADEVAAWNKQCADKPADNFCGEKRYKISKELGEFVALVNDYLRTFRDVTPNAPDDFIKKTNGRRKVMELEVSNALHVIKCIGVPASDPQCDAESTAIDKEKAVIEADYKDTVAEFTTSGFDGKWISLRGVSSPAPTKP